MTGRGPARRSSLARRTAAACLLVAVIAVGVAALVSLRLVSATAREVTRDVLAQQADVVAAQLASAGGPVRGAVGLRRVVEVLRGQGVTVALLGRDRPAGDVATILQRAGAERATTGEVVSATVAVDGTVWLVEARPTDSGAFALLRTSDAGLLGSGLIRRNLGFSLFTGAVTALVVGTVVGRLLARPLRRTAAAAHELRGGRRDVRVPVEGPVEVAEVAAAVNELADALARSEGRQREFLLSVSHELRTPLTAVRGFAESLADGVVQGVDVAPAGATILAEAHRLDRLVADLLELARLGADDFRIDLAPVDLTAFAVDAAAVWRNRCERAGVAFVLEVPGGPVTVVADHRRLRQVLDGLADNALRVTPAGAPMVLAVRGAWDGTGNGAGNGPGNGAVLELRDGGPGLDAQDYPVVFERGALHDRYRGHRPVGAGGIGLALVHGLVTRMGGEILARPAAEGGVRFTVTLPRA